ncbi:MAG: four helix bundle protein [Terracidiphilus sp.]|jgi:four helix bundle protein
MAQDYRDLVVWQKAIDLTVCIYQLTRAFPKDEMYGLISQMRRASVSAASNIAEGRGRLSSAEFRQFLGLAQGSIYELQTQLIVVKRLALANADVLTEAGLLSNEVSKMLSSFIQTLNSTAGKKKLGARS